MKSKHFYSHLIETTDITVELAEMELTPDERIHLISLIEANIHSTVVNTVLSNLTEEDKKIFLKNLVSNDHQIIWTHLKNKTKKIEEKIIKSVGVLKQEFYKDIKEIRKDKN
ncbi:MAG: hypothetical protein M1405_03245 [Patescibacteria group bacterium]|nr:hypothetical protein [Patescibacteria group bacterium]